MPNQSLARIMYGTSTEFSVAAAATAPLNPRTNLSDRKASRSVQSAESIAELLSKAWDRLFHKH